MKCVYCNHDIPALWQQLYTTTSKKGTPLGAPTENITVHIGMRGQNHDQPWSSTAQLFWMQCPNDKCGELLIVVRHGYHNGRVSLNLALAEIWYALPKKRCPRPIAEEVPEPFKTDYIEAAMILEDSPRMSAVLSRRILADVLAEYANLKGFKLSKQTEKFVADTTYPTPLRDNVEHFREIADFGAHTQKDETGAIIDVTLEEAEWTLELLDGFFDYFIVARERDKKRREAFDKKIADAGRKPLDKKS
jgi:hypothetical protein